MYACTSKSGADFPGVVQVAQSTTRFSRPAPTASRINARKRKPRQRRTGLTTWYLPRSLDQTMNLGHELVNVVVVAVICVVGIPSLR
jgi:hypothetical protein